MKRSLMGAIGAAIFTAVLMISHTVIGHSSGLSGVQASASYSDAGLSAVEAITGVSDTSRLDSLCGSNIDCMAMIAPYFDQTSGRTPQAIYYRTPVPNGLKRSLSSDGRSGLYFDPGSRLSL